MAEQHYAKQASYMSEVQARVPATAAYHGSGGVAMTRTIIAALLACACAPALPADTGAQARREKCAYLWQRMAPKHFSPKLAEFLVAEHERQGIGDQWFFSLVYGYSGSDLNPRMVCSGGGMTAMGIMDCTELNLPRAECLRRFGTDDRSNSWVGIASHVRQAANHHRDTGREGWSLMRSVFLPARPDGSRAYQEQRRWQGIAALMKSHLSDWYCTRSGQK